jgi:Holliday junction resolvasome RuvABC endonuclease subunit
MVTGRGAASKPQVGYFVKALLGLRRPPNADAADALAIAICHARLHGSPRAQARATLAAPSKPASRTRAAVGASGKEPRS